MERKTWERDDFFVNSNLDWNCPNCNIGTLKISENEFNFKETNESKKQKLNFVGEREFPKYVFNGSLECYRCKEKVVFIGNGRREIFEILNKSQDEYDDEFLNQFYPKYFYPPLKIITIPNKCPKSVSTAINQSFSLFWNDISSCANKLRVSLELLLDELKVERTQTLKSQKIKDISLHKRIKIYSEKNPKIEISDLLLAIKWIGNSGSHSVNLNRNDIINCYETIELSLNKIYDTKEKELTDWAKKTNEKYEKK